MMTEHKSDDLSATGTHRAWTGETIGSMVRTGAPRDIRRDVNRDVKGNWLDRSQTPPAAANSRHAAITRSLNSWSSYKSWTDKVRHNWDKDKSGK